MFVDEVNITVIAGSGGDGCMAFRREKYIPMGGPFGGSGGSGGNIIFEADAGLKTLIDLKYRRIFKGKNGLNGAGKNKNGKSAEDTVVRVPIGTTLKDIDNGYILADLVKHGDTCTVAFGGRGGRGNVSLSSKSNPCPSFCENGEPGETRNINATLRMVADVGLVGFPSVGKSTILSVISNANPKIASYHFTTLSPNLGVVTNSKNSFVVADLPGLIEGASSGLGLGDQFLKHIERTKIIAHVVDISGLEGRNPYYDYVTICNELSSYNAKLLEKPMIIICNKIDSEGALENFECFKKKIDDHIKVFGISAINNKGLDEVINYLSDLVDSVVAAPLVEEEKMETHVLYKFKEERPFTIAKVDNAWLIKGSKIEKLLLMTNFSSAEAYDRFAKKLRRMGIDDELEKKGVQEGDIVRILDYEFEYTK